MRKVQPKEGAPLVVAVPSLMPEFALWNPATHTLSKVYGGNLSENSLYIAGTMPKSFRMAAEDCSYENELVLRPLPASIEEVVLSENPDLKLVITNCQQIEVQPKAPAKACKVIEHPAAWFAKAKKLHTSKRKDDNQLLLFPPPEDLRAAG